MKLLLDICIVLSRIKKKIHRFDETLNNLLKISIEKQNTRKTTQNINFTFSYSVDGDFIIQVK